MQVRRLEDGLIVVISTAKDAVGLAGLCTASVRAQGPKVRGHEVWHSFAAVDEATARDAAGDRTYVDCSTATAAPQLANFQRMWGALAPDVIVVLLDGDDMLAPGALERVAHFYEREDVWASYGSFVTDTRRLDWAWHHHFGRRYAGPPRKEVWRASHLKTFRAGLVQRVPVEYFNGDDGQPYPLAVDQAVMFPVLELAGERYVASTDVNCVYTTAHSFAAQASPEELEREAACRAHIRQRTPLERLNERPW